VTSSLKRFLPVLVLAALAAGAWFQLIAPKREEAARIGAEVATAQAELGQLQAKVAEYGKAREGYGANVAAVTRLGKAVPADDDMGSLMVQLDAATRRSGVDFRSVQVSGDAAAAPATGSSGATVTPGATIPGAVEVPGSDISTMPFTFAFQGSFSGLSGFLARLQRFVTLHGRRIAVNGRLLRVESISMKPSEKGFPQIRAQVKASSFLAPASKGAAGAGTAAPSTAATPGTGGTGGTGETGGTTPKPSTTTADATGAVQ
jgi:hypothetical protein